MLVYSLQILLLLLRVTYQDLRTYFDHSSGGSNTETVDGSLLVTYVGMDRFGRSIYQCGKTLDLAFHGGKGLLSPL